ncbi:succinate dehydrogenase, cytochrome b556 subunit [Acidihalobacter prosperus]
MKPRPVYLDLFRISLPVPGIISFAHRISGVLLVLGIPFGLYLLYLSLSGPEDFGRARDIIRSPWLIPVLLPWTWSLCHHFLSGIRFLFMDIDIGVDKKNSYRTAVGVGLAALALAILLLTELYR